jgi:hypothetical protein
MKVLEKNNKRVIIEVTKNEFDGEETNFYKIWDQIRTVYSQDLFSEESIVSHSDGKILIITLKPIHKIGNSLEATSGV